MSASIRVARSISRTTAVAALTCALGAHTAHAQTHGFLRGPFVPGSGTYALVPGGSFENGLPPGTEDIGALLGLIRPSSSLSQVGSWSAVTETPVDFNGAGYALGIAPVSVLPGQQYVLSGFLNASALLNTTEMSSIYLDLNDVLNEINIGLWSVNTGFPFLGEPEWVFVWGIYVPPSGTTFVRIRLVRDGKCFAGEQGYFDEVALTPIESFIPPVACPDIRVHPAPAIACPSGEAQLAIQCLGTGPLSYAWQYEDPAMPGSWLGLSDGPLVIDGTEWGTISDASTNTMNARPSASGFQVATSLRLRCVVSNACGSATSGDATLRVCAADFSCDGFVNGDDYDSFASLFEAGDSGADVNSDGFVNGDDYDYFASAFEAGC